MRSHRTFVGAIAAVLCAVMAFLPGAVDAQERRVAEPARRDAPRADADRVALVIGNADYRALPRLVNPRNDAQDMCATLKHLGFSVICALDVATRRGLRDHVRQFAARLQPNSLAMFYYAGHGVQYRGENFLLPADMEAHSTADIEDEALSLNYVLRTLEEARSAPNVVIVDACRDNPFSRPGEIGTARGLARTEPPLGTVLVYATAPNSVAIDGHGRNGLFTKHLLANLPRAGLKIEELMQVVAKAVEDEARAVYRREQVPFRSSSFAGTYCLAGCENPQFAERLNQITRQSDEAMRRITELSEENAKLRAEAQQRAARIADMEARIARLNESSNRSGADAKGAGEELRRLREELELARQGQRERDRAAQRNDVQEKELAELRSRLATLQRQAGELSDAKGRQRAAAGAGAATGAGAEASARTETELIDLKKRLAGLQAQAQQIDDYRSQIQRLQKENEEKTQLLQERQKRQAQEASDRRRSPVVVPSF